MNIKLIFGLMLAGFTVLFIIQNATVVQIRFLYWTLSLSHSLLIFFILAFGIFIGWLLHVFFMHRQQREKNTSRDVS
jgi:putative membrane protein